MKILSKLSCFGQNSPPATNTKEFPFTHDAPRCMAVGVLKEKSPILFNNGPNAQAVPVNVPVQIICLVSDSFAINVSFPYEVILHFMSHPSMVQSVVFMDAGILLVLS